jgi:hypothetical protein
MSDFTHNSPEGPDANDSDRDLRRAETDEGEQAGTSVLEDTPEIDVDAYIAAQERSARRAKNFLKFAAGVAVIAIPLTIASMGGRLSFHGLGHPAPTPSPGSFSLSPTTPSADGVSPQMRAVLKKDPAVAADLAQYAYHDLKAINPDERTALMAFSGVTQKNFRNLQLTYATLGQTVIPAYTRFVQEAEAIHPKTAPVQEIHRLFLRSAKVKLLAFKHIQEGEDDPDAVWQYGVKAEFYASGMLAKQFSQAVNELGRIEGVKMP